jgi:serine phosphatase RsbU (regulator of sigma subunit)
MSVIPKVLKKKPHRLKKANPSVPGKGNETNAAQDVFRIGLRRTETDPLNNKVWRAILVILASCTLAIVFGNFLGHESFLGVWLAAVFILTAWVFAVRMLLLDSLFKKFWLIWLAGGFLLMFLGLTDEVIWLAGFASSFVFLLFRRYKPYLHLTSRRRAALFLLGVVLFMTMIIFPVSSGYELDFGTSDAQAAEAAVPEDAGFAITLGWKLNRYATTSVEFFWLFSIFYLFFNIRLHFMRLRPKLAVVAVLLVLVPLLLVTVIWMVALYSTLGESRAIRANMVLEDWAEFAFKDPEFIHTLSQHSFSLDAQGNEVFRQGDLPAWLAGFQQSFASQDFSALEWDPAQKAAYIWIDKDIWLVVPDTTRETKTILRACRLDGIVLDRLARILHSNIRISFASNVTFRRRDDSGSRRTINFGQGEDIAAITGKLRPETPTAEEQADASQSFFRRNIYFGVTSFSVLTFRQGKFAKETILLVLEGSLADLAGELAGEHNPLSQFVLILLAILACLLLIMELFALFFGLRITTGFTSAVRSLYRGTRRIAAGDFDTRIDIPNEDELGDLAASFNDMAAAVKKGREEAIARERLESELQTARKIQERLLPDVMPEVHGFEVAGTSIPSQQVGGDYFDFLDMGEGQWGIAIADVSGKGIPAALLMANLQASLHAQVIQPGEVAEVTCRINDRLVESTDANMFATFFYGILDRVRSEFTSTNAGHNPPILLKHDGRVVRLGAGGLLLGFMADQDYAQESQTLDPGDILVLFTDGITEAVDTALEEVAENLFGEHRLLEVLRENQESSAREIQAAILRAIAEHTGNSPQSDDITLVVIKRRPSEVE